MASLVPAARPSTINWVETRKVIAELLETFLLVFVGVGSAVFGIDRIGPVGVALSFGLTLEVPWPQRSQRCYTPETSDADQDPPNATT